MAKRIIVWLLSLRMNSENIIMIDYNILYVVHSKWLCLIAIIHEFISLYRGRSSEYFTEYVFLNELFFSIAVFPIFDPSIFSVIEALEHSAFDACF